MFKLFKNVEGLDVLVRKSYDNETDEFVLKIETTFPDSFADLDLIQRFKGTQAEQEIAMEKYFDTFDAGRALHVAREFAKIGAEMGF